MIDKFQYRVEDPKAASRKPAIKDFKRLNKVVLKEGATSAAQNRALRANHDMKVQSTTGRKTNQTVLNSSDGMVFGRANRPQTPVNGIISNTYGEGSQVEMAERYSMWMKKRAQSKGPVGIRMTNAQIHADASVKAKNTYAEARPEFKLKRFQNVNPRTSTKRGDNAYMVLSKSMAIPAATVEQQ